MPERLARPREPIPSLRGEDETEISYLTDLIQDLSWSLFLSGRPTCVLGRHPQSPDTSSTFRASLYRMTKGDVKCLEIVPEMRESRKEVLTKLLSVVETEVGKMMLRDARRAAAGGDGHGGRSGRGNGGGRA